MHMLTRDHRFLLTYFLSAIVAAQILTASAAPIDEVYLLGPDSLPHEGTPRGKVIGPLTLASQVFTNTARHYWIYVPAQYDPKTPASLMIFQDGQAFVNSNGDYRIPDVFDNLIYRREMPVTIAVFVNPATRRNNRNPLPPIGATPSITAAPNTTSSMTNIPT